MRYQAARMHKKAVRRAKQDRHRLTQRRYVGKCASASSRRVTRHARRASVKSSQAPQRAHTSLHSVAAPLALRDRARSRVPILPWMVLLALAVPATLNFHNASWHRLMPAREEDIQSMASQPLQEAASAPTLAAHESAPLADALQLQEYATALQLRAQELAWPQLADFKPLTQNLFEESTQHVHMDRLIAVQAVTLGVGIYGMRYMNGIFGGVAQPFQVGNDWNKDNFLHFDELLHLQGGYRITQAVSSIYRWAGVKPTHADWIGAGTAATLMTTMEYIDGRRKNDEASYSDFAANFLGVGLALAKPRWRPLQDFDLRLSYRTLSDPFDRHRMKRYDRMTHWLTYDLDRRWKIPVHVGVGYSVHRAGTPRAKAEYFFGVGISPQALLKHVSPSASQSLGWLDLYHFGNQVQINKPNAPTRKAKRSGS